MDFPIIDISKQSVQQFETQCSRGKALRQVMWYRLVRPSMVLGMWTLAAAYIRWCLAHASPEELSLDALMPSIIGIGSMGCVLTAWVIGRKVDQRSSRSRGRPMFMADGMPSDATNDIVLAANSGRRLVAYHDDDGLVSQVMSMPAEARQPA
jgi:hypothetical protein